MLFFGKAFQVSLPAGAKVDVESPEPPDEGFGVLVVLGTDFASSAASRAW